MFHLEDYKRLIVHKTINIFNISMKASRFKNKGKVMNTSHQKDYNTLKYFKKYWFHYSKIPDNNTALCFFFAFDNRCSTEQVINYLWYKF